MTTTMVGPFLIQGVCGRREERRRKRENCTGVSAGQKTQIARTYYWTAPAPRTGRGGGGHCRRHWRQLETIGDLIMARLLFREDNH